MLKVNLITVISACLEFFFKDVRKVFLQEFFVIVFIILVRDQDRERVICLHVVYWAVLVNAVRPINIGLFWEYGEYGSVYRLHLMDVSVLSWRVRRDTLLEFINLSYKSIISFSCGSLACFHSRGMVSIFPFLVPAVRLNFCFLRVFNNKLDSIFFDAGTVIPLFGPNSGAVDCQLFAKES